MKVEQVLERLLCLLMLVVLVAELTPLTLLQLRIERFDSSKLSPTSTIEA